jgi:hypothetical protein
MRVFGVVLAQVVIVVLVGGLVMPAVLFSVPQTRESGPVVFGLLVVVLFALLRLAWPSRRRDT